MTLISFGEGIGAISIGIASLIVAANTLASPPHTASATQLGMPTATPESQGFSTAGLDALNKEMHALVDAKKLAGVTTLIARHGKVVHLDTYGAANATTGEPLKPTASSASPR